MSDLFEKHKNQAKLRMIRRIIIEIGVIFAIFLLAGLLNKNLMFFSKNVYYSYSYPDNIEILDPLSPINDISIIGEKESQQYLINNQLIKSNATEFSIKLPSTLKAEDFQTAQVKMTFDPYNTEEFLMGIKNTSTNEFSYKPAYNKTLEELDWRKVSANGLTLWQKDKEYNSFSDFLSSPPKTIMESKIVNDEIETEIKISIADYHSSFDQSDLIARQLQDKAPTQTESSTPFIEGGVTAYTFLTKPADLVITVEKHDNNYYQGADPVEVTIYNSENTIVKQEVIPDDGVTSAGAENGPLQRQIITLPKSNKGLYKITTGAGDAYTRLIVNQPYLVIENQMTIEDNPFNENSEPYTIYTNAQEVKILTWHVPATNQTLLINGYNEFILDSDRIDQKFIRLRLGQKIEALNKIKLGINHIGMANNDSGLSRYFSFSEESFFNPFPLVMKQFKADTDIKDDSEIKYILARYQSLQKKGDLYTLSAVFDIRQDKITNTNTITFSVLAPQLEKERNTIKVTLIDILVSK